MNKPAQRSCAGLRILTSVLTLLLCSTAMALPEDAGKPTFIDGGSLEAYQEGDLSISVYTGTSEIPVVITQGTLKISGMQIRIENKNKAIVKITAMGKPASYQQQLNADEELTYLRGQELIFDNAAQILSVNKDAELEQAGRTTSAYHFEFDLQTNHFKASKSPDGEQVRMVIPPPASQ